MFFNSFDYLLFFSLCFALYLLLQILGRHRLQNRMLLVASYLFYAAWDWRFCFLIAFSTLVDYHVALAMHGSNQPRRRRLLVTTSLVVNLGLLGYFKYANFFAQGLQDLLELLGFGLSRFTVDVILPVGISFYTFQTLSYTIDVYRRRVVPVRQPLDFALYVAFFPQLVAGPIERASRFLPQILQPRQLDWNRFNSGGWLVFWGLFKKVVIADNLAKLVDMVYASASTPTSAEIGLATYAFAFQIYCDFSGYTDIARGCARMLGFDLMLNFRLPYFAVNPSDFWRRWHISLSTWLRDYLYISLGGNRLGRWLTLRNLMLTMLLGGLWHGAAMPFVIWGGYHGALLILHRLARPALERRRPRSAVLQAAWRGLRIVATFHLVCLGWLIFRSNSTADLLAHLAVLTGPFEWGLAPHWLLPFAALLLPLVLIQIAQERSGELEVVLRWPLPLRAGLYVLLALMIVFLGEDGGEPFIYFQF